MVNSLVIKILQRLLLKCFYHSRKEECSSGRASNQERVDLSISKLSPLLRQNCENKRTNSILYPVSLVDIWTKAFCKLLTLENVSIQTQNHQIKILLICILYKKNIRCHKCFVWTGFVYISSVMKTGILCRLPFSTRDYSLTGLLVETSKNNVWFSASLFTLFIIIDK